MHTPTLFRTFKRHYHKVAAVAERLASKGTFSLRIEAVEGAISASLETPDDEETTRFVVLMRRFLAPSDPIFYRRVWKHLLDGFPEEIPQEVIQGTNAHIERLNRGNIGVNINGENLTAERIYQILADGEYFGKSDDAQTFLESLKGVPVIGPLFWQQFYDYTLNGYTLAHVLFDIVVLVEQSQKYQMVHAVSPPPKSQCIYCLTNTASFTSEEHVFPESLGNDELVLPKGYVCDRCNNEILSGLDSSLLRFEPIALLQVQFVPYTKSGKLPSANFQNLALKRTSPRHITITAKDKTANMRNKENLGNGWFSFSINIRGSEFRPHVLGRALFKIALGMVAFSQGHDIACGARYDMARDFIHGRTGFPNNLVLKTTCVPGPQVRVEYCVLSDGTLFAVDIYGLQFIINIEPRPVLQLNDVLSEAQFTLVSLS